MAPHKKPVAAFLAILALGWSIVVSGRVSADGAPAPRRIISLVPAATEMLFAVGAGPQVVAVGSYDNYPAEARSLPKVGALLDPDVERILSLRPDLVFLYASQDDLKRQLTRAGIAVFDYRHAGLADVLETIRAVGQRSGHAARGRELASAIQRDLDAIKTKVRGQTRPRTLLVFGREALALRGIYASGGTGFLNDMLAAAGGDNVFADIPQESVQATTETIIARQPQVILEIRGSDSALPFADRQAEVNVWKRLSSVPAVRNGRVQFLVDDRLVIPGPRIAEGTRLIAAALHPDAFR